MNKPNWLEEFRILAVFGVFMLMIFPAHIFAQNIERLQVGKIPDNLYPATFPEISGNGRYVLYHKKQSSLTGSGSDLYRYDRLKKKNKRIVRNFQSGQIWRDYSTQISNNGNKIAYIKNGYCYVYTVSANRARRINIPEISDSEVACTNINIDRAGRYVSLKGVETDGNPGRQAIIRYDLKTRVFKLKSGYSHIEPEINISGNGNVITFTASSNYVFNVANNTLRKFRFNISTSPYTQQFYNFNTRDLSANGRYLIDVTDRDLLRQGSNGRNVYIYDVTTKRLRNLTNNFEHSIVHNTKPEITDDGKYLIYKILLNEGNCTRDVYYIQRTSTMKREKYLDFKELTNKCLGVRKLSFSANARYAVFESEENGFVPTDSNNKRDIFVYNADSDNDGVPFGIDNCPNTKNSNQRDANKNGIGDLCEVSIFPTLSILLLTKDNNNDYRADVNGDGVINNRDSSLVQQFSAGNNMTGTGWKFTPTTGDCNCNGNTDISDALLIDRFILGLDMSVTDWCVEF